MGVEICKRITINEKKNIVSIYSASSNWTPREYFVHQYKAGKTFDENLLLLFSDFLFGNIHIGAFNRNTAMFEYANIKVREQAFDIDKLWDECHTERVIDNDMEWQNKIIEIMKSVLAEPYKIWKSALLESIDGDFMLMQEHFHGGYISDLSNYTFRNGFRWYRVSLDAPLKMSYKQAYMVMKELKNSIPLKIIKA